MEPVSEVIGECVGRNGDTLRLVFNEHPRTELDHIRLIYVLRMQIMKWKKTKLNRAAQKLEMLLNLPPDKLDLDA